MSDVPEWMQLLRDHCFPFEYSTFLWVSSPCGVVHWNSIVAQTSASNQHHFPTCLPQVSLPLLDWLFFSTLYHFLQIFFGKSLFLLESHSEIPREKKSQRAKWEWSLCQSQGEERAGSFWKVKLKANMWETAVSPTAPLSYRPELLPPLLLHSDAHS